MAKMRFIKDPVFILGLFVRVAIIISVFPFSAQTWYVPFLENNFGAFSLDPWETHLAKGGLLNAFPYGYAMWFVLAPLANLANAFAVPVYYGYAGTLLLFDISLLVILNSLNSSHWRPFLFLYWCSPVVIFATYFLGLNDLIPVTFLCLSLLLLIRESPILSGIVFAVAASAKISMIAAFPLILFYLWRNRTNNTLAAPFTISLTLFGFIFNGLFFLSPSALEMFALNPDVQKIYDLSINFGDGGQIYLLGITYFVLLYAVWRIGRFSFGMLTSFLAITFFLFLLLTPASPGWFVWVIPFLSLIQIQTGRRMKWLVLLFSITYVLIAFLGVLGIHTLVFESTIAQDIAASNHLRGIFLTILYSFGILLCWRIWREAVRKNDSFELSRKPFVIGIAGDSGSGKDTLADSLAGLFGSHSVAGLSGDDYHLWDRNKPMWQALTHLNPQSNDLEKFTSDVVDLSNRRSILARHYDHGEGLKGKPYRLAKNDFVLVTGLHALFSKPLRDCYDVSIYLDIDESLRRYYKLKRDVFVRGHSRDKVIEAIERRSADFKKFIKPQKKYADLVMSLQPIHSHLLDDLRDGHVVRTRLFVMTKQNGAENRLRRLLVGICGLHVDLDSNEKYLSLTIEGDVCADDIALAARQLMPNIGDILDLHPEWENGTLGLMQLFVLSHLYEQRFKR